MELSIAASLTARLSIGVSQVGAPPTTYTLTVYITGGGSVNLDPPGGTYDEDTEVELEAVPDPGWRFDHWEDDLSGSDNPETIIMDADKTVTAVFKRKSHAAAMLGVHF